MIAGAACGSGTHAVSDVSPDADAGNAVSNRSQGVCESSLETYCSQPRARCLLDWAAAQAPSVPSQEYGDCMNVATEPCAGFLIGGRNGGTNFVNFYYDAKTEKLVAVVVFGGGQFGPSSPECVGGPAFFGDPLVLGCHVHTRSTCSQPDSGAQDEGGADAPTDG